MRIEFDHLLEREDQTITVYVSADVSKSREATYYQPAEPAEIEVTSIIDRDGEELDVTDAELAEIVEAGWKEVESHADDAYYGDD